MAQSDDRSLDDAQVSDQLVAYLDGELDEQAARQIEQQLATDPLLRESLRQLQQSWDLLDMLPQATTDEGLTRTTVEMAALEMQQALPAETARARRRQLSYVAIGALGLILSVVIGFGFTEFMLNRKNRQFLRDLPVIEKVDLYQQVDDLGFLQELAAEGLFDDEIDPSEDSDEL